MDKKNEASISFKRAGVILIAVILMLSGIGVTFISTKLGGIKVISAEKTYIAQSSDKSQNNENNENDGELLESVLASYTTVTEKVVTEEVAIPYETETKDSSSGSGETVEKIIKNGSDGKKEIVYIVRTTEGASEEKIQIAENVVEEPVNCVKEIKDKEIPVVTSRSSSSIDNSDDDYEEEQYDGSDNGEWDGRKLTKSAGVVPASQTPSGYRETYYNLNMNGCLRAMGLDSDGYGVRADGVKTYNGYVMVASPNLSKYPKGSYIPTTLGMGYVVDYCPSGALDIAVTW